jgi:glycosyltransferase involved in cell wall biosynthesis
MPPREVIVVVDHNPSLLEKTRASLASVLVIQNTGSQGLSAARNSGVEAARGTLIAFLDDDAIAAPDWLEQLVQLCQNPTVLGTGGAVEPTWVSKRPAWLPEEFYWVVGCSYRGLPATTASVRNLFGGCLCIRRDVLMTLGGFRDGIGRVGSKPMGGEETELCIRARRRWPTGVFFFEPRARIFHRVHADRTRWRYFLARCFAEGMSKALLSRLVGAKAGLASERSYVAATLPKGIARALADFLSRGDASDLFRAGAIVVGLATTTAGYIAGALKYHRALLARSSTALAR